MTAQEKNLVRRAEKFDHANACAHDQTRQRRFERRFLSLDCPDAVGNLFDYGPAWLLNAAVEYTLTPARHAALTLFAEGRNLLDTRYRDHGGVPQPGRTVMAGLKLNMNKL